MTTKTKLAILLLATVIPACNSAQRNLLESASGGVISTGNWLKLVGVWELTGGADFTLVFRGNGTFEDHLEGERRGGDFVPDGPLHIIMYYDPPCGDGPDETPCRVKLRYEVEGSKLVITVSQGDLVFRKVEE